MSQNADDLRFTSDPTLRELKRLVQLPGLDACPKVIRDGVKAALEKANKRYDFCQQVSSKSETMLTLQHFTLAHDWNKVHLEGKTKFFLAPRKVSSTLAGQFLKMLVSLQKPRRVLELGMYTGCGAVAMAEALPADGTLVTIDREPYLREVTQQFYDSFPQGKRIQVKIGEVKETLKAMLAEGRQFDLMFFDADKLEYVEYYKMAMDQGLLAPGGTLVVDNALWRGFSYMRPPGNLEDNPLRVFIDYVSSDPRVESVLLPLDDGMMIIRRKEDITE